MEGLDQLVQSVWFVAYRYSMPPIPLKAFLGLRDHNAWEDFRAVVEDSGLGERIGAQVPQNLDVPVSTEAWERIDIDLRHALGLFAALQSKASWVVFDFEVLDSLSEQARDYFLERLKERITLIVYSRDLMKLGQYGENLVAVINEEGLKGLGTARWAQAHMPEIRRTLREAKHVAAEHGAGDLRDQDLDSEVDLSI
jgi:hypothetical protein